MSRATIGKLHRELFEIRNFLKFISPAFCVPVSVVLLLLETAVTAPFWVMIQLVAFLTPLLATVLLLIEQFNQCLPKHTA